VGIYAMAGAKDIYESLSPIFYPRPVPQQLADLYPRNSVLLDLYPLKREILNGVSDDELR